MGTVLLVDGNPLVWRSVDIYKNLRTKTGKATGAIYGAFEILFRAIDHVKPDSIVVTWDVGKSRWRRALSPDYKASREARKPNDGGLPFEEIIPQFSDIQRLLMLAGIPQFGIQGVEADDLIGLLASGLAKSQSHDIVILSSDGDLNQLLSEKVRQYDSVGKRWVDLEKVKEVYNGLTPAQLIELKAITGDGGDDIKGVKGIGPSGAHKLLTTFGSLDACLDDANQAQISSLGKRLAAFTEARDTVKLARKLVTITTVDNYKEFLSAEEIAVFVTLLRTKVEPNRFSFSQVADSLELERVNRRAGLLFVPSPELEQVSQWFM